MKRIGSANLWFVVRLSELFTLTGFLLFFWAGGGREVSVLFVVGVALVLAYQQIFFDSFVYADADDQGIYYRRYVKRRFVSWRNLDRIEWDRLEGLVIYLKGGTAPRNRLRFMFDLSLYELVAYLSGKWEPEILPWLDRQVAKAKDEQVSWHME